MSIKTEVVSFHTEVEAKQYIVACEAAGWTVVGYQVTREDKGWNPSKTCCLGLIFLPLALLGRNPDNVLYTITLQKETEKLHVQ